MPRVGGRSGHRSKGIGSPRQFVAWYLTIRHCQYGVWSFEPKWP